MQFLQFSDRAALCPYNWEQTPTALTMPTDHSLVSPDPKPPELTTNLQTSRPWEHGAKPELWNLDSNWIPSC